MLIYERAGKTVEQLKELIIKETVVLDGFRYKFCDYKKDNIIPEVDNSWQILPGFMPLDGADIHMWIRGKFKTPSAKAGYYYAIDFVQENEKCNTQTLIYLNGEMIQGLDLNHTRTFLEPNTSYDVAFYCYFDNINPYSAMVPKLVTICEKTEQLYFDFFVPYDAATAVVRNSYEYFKILHHLELADNYIDFRQPYSQAYYESVDRAIAYLKEAFYTEKVENQDAIVDCMGQSHIDVAWLWPLRQTVEKVQRSFSTVIHLMKRYPEYLFMMTSPQLYTYIKESAPELYENIKEKIRDGQWEADGAMWLEADVNLPSGESLIRQLIYGKKFFMDEFGVDSRILWIPDVFGYSAALPQILRKAGVDRFVTSKISWNDTNRMPNDIFLWKGIDGTEIFTYFLTTKDFTNHDETKYFAMLNGALDAREIKSTWDLYRNKEFNNSTIHTFGFGDGGGGPTYQMLEQQRRFSYGIPGIPKTRMNTIKNFLDKAEGNFNTACKKYGRTPKWSGELYLELHRGTYTSMAKTKRLNRKCEAALSEAEKLSVFNLLVNESNYPDFSEDWKILLLNQFHDIIPGSSIREVYETSNGQYIRVLENCRNISNKMREKLGKSISGEGYVIFNPHSYECTDIVEAEGSFAYAENIPALGYAVVDTLYFENNAIISKNSISNNFFDIKLNENGNIVYLFDKVANREVISGEANKFCAYEDNPYIFDAWEIADYYAQKSYEMNENVEFAEYRNGAKAGITVKRRFMESEIIQNIVVYDRIPRIDFETVIDWKQEHILVKSFFPINVFSNKVTAEIQFGYVERSTHSNTSWDEAKFEMCMHKWVDISDNGYGVSILNDCKYGFSCDENVLGITVLKSATDPNPEADKCIHKFTYSIFPHEGHAVIGGTVQQAYNINQPMTAVKVCGGKGKLPKKHSFISCDKDNVIIETVKKAQEGRSIVLRIYDAYNISTEAEFVFGFDVKRAYICDLLENKLSEVVVCDNSVKVNIKNFEIITLMLEI